MHEKVQLEEENYRLQQEIKQLKIEKNNDH